MYPMRTWFKDEILAEFFPPYLGKEGKESSKAIIFCDGAPGVPSSPNILRYWSKRGYWVFRPRYRGTWESRGVFMEKEPTEDVIDIIDELESKQIIISEWDQNEINIKNKIKDFFVIGKSFGGPAAIFASRDSRVKKVVAMSPVIDWRAPSEDEPLEVWPEIVESSFGMGYRTTREIWDKLQTGKFYNPTLHMDEFDASKIMIIHALDDTDIRAKEILEFAEKVSCNLQILKKGGHNPVDLDSWWWARKIKIFFGN